MVVDNMTELKEYTIDILHIKTIYQFLLSIVAAVFGGLITHIQNIAIENIDAMHSISILLLVDWLIGMYNALITVDKKTGKSLFKTKKSFKILAYFIAYFSLLFLTGSIEKSFDYASWLTEAVMMPIIVGQVVSILKNMTLVGWINNKLLKDILHKVDGYKDEIIENALNVDNDKEEKVVDKLL